MAEPAWLPEAVAWALEARRAVDPGSALAGPAEVIHNRPWSTVVRVPVTGGDLFLKATLPALNFEPALTQALAAWRPDCMPRVLAIDAGRGWMLMLAAGPTLRSQIQASPEPLRTARGHWDRILPLYAGLQQELMVRVPELLRLGALDRRLATLPGQYARVLEDTAALRIDAPDGLTADDYERLVDLQPRLEALCAALAAAPIPDTLHHDDFHDGNIFVRDLTGGAGYAFFDWAESCVAHPFFSMVVGMRAIAFRLGLEPESPEIVRLRECYLEAWKPYAPIEHLREILQLALPAGMVCRALTWYRVVTALPEPYRSEHADAVPGWLSEFLQAMER